MRTVIQRVQRAHVSVNGETLSAISRGLLILVGVGPEDGEAEAHYLTNKIANLRIFEDDAGKTNRSLLDVGGEALVVSQFTLYADTRKGRRPSFTQAAPPDMASSLVDHFADMLRALGVPTQTGAFGAYMQVELVNDGPMTIVIER
jgi:D-tyrosyl-tRNA(Tyr) deacylase